MATVSLAEPRTGDRPPVSGTTGVSLTDHTGEILASGLPGLRSLSDRSRRRQLEGYLYCEARLDGLSGRTRKSRRCALRNSSRSACA